MPIALSYALLIALGVVPSLVWLFYYLRKDCHPEPRSMIAKTFLMGIIVSPIAIIFQLLFVKFVTENGQSVSWFPTIAPRGYTFFLWAALVEECVKFFAVRVIDLYDPEFDEPVDAMVYMITAGLGFAAMENIIILFRVIPDGVNAAASVWMLRFLGATLLHALSCAIVGYFVALSWFFHQHAKKLIFTGLVVATVFHFTFNIFLSTFSDQLQSLAAATLLLVAMGFLVSILFDKIKERHSASLVTLA